ncbi:cbb3-type cytochrome oxidase assembly protein CcoS [Dyella sp. 20L07]|uniref:cbb3-type cytochrome oxidase assembly protein CcoS n=1 Tax=Dyella sp. 20L07 TaxID=3384240 RepID=UPI003D292410
MIILLMLIPLSLMLLAAAIWAFTWAVRKGQFDDMDTPPLDILSDDPLVHRTSLERDHDA